MRIPWDRHLTIRGRLLLLLLAMAVPFVAYLSVSTWRLAGLERRHAGEQMLGFAKLTAARLDDRIGDIRQTLVVLEQVVDPAVAATAANDELLGRVLPRVPSEIGGLGVWNAAGENVGSGSASVPARFPYALQRRLFREAAVSTKLLIEAPVVSPDTGEKVAFFALPIVRDGRFAGLVAASIRLHAFDELLLAGRTLPEGAVVTVSSAGIVIARSLDPEHWIGRPLRPGGGPPPPDGVRDAVSQDGIARIGGLTRSNRTDWSVYVGIPTEAVLAPVHAQVREYFVVGALVLLAGLGVALWIANRISSPLASLGEDAARFEQGVWTHRSPVREGGEIGALATLLNRMADTVQERTDLLSASEARLREITDNLPLLISVLDRDRRFRFASRAYRDWLGLEPAGMIGKSLAEIYGASTYERIEAHIDAGLAGRRVVYERDLDSAAGVRRIEVTLIPRLAADGEVDGLYVQMQDVTANRRAVAKMRQTEERLTLALEGSGAALFDWQIATGMIYHSASSGTLRGARAREHTAPVSKVVALMHPEDVAPAQAAADAAVGGRLDRFEAEYRLAGQHGDWIWIRSLGRVVERDSQGRALRLAGTSTDVTQRRMAEERLRHLATYDTLTGLPNRALFHDRLAQAITRLQREPDGTTAVLYLDIDHFKQVNDTLGHRAGDQLLKEFAAMMQQTVRGADTVARLSGDEFAIILEGLCDAGEAHQVAQRLVAGARRMVGSDERAVRVSTSIGIALLQRDDRDVGELLARADTALYDAKRAGRDRHAFHGSPRAATVALTEIA